MLSQMNYRKETQPHGDELFPLSIHVFETDLQSTVRPPLSMQTVCMR